MLHTQVAHWVPRHELSETGFIAGAWKRRAREWQTNECCRFTLWRIGVKQKPKLVIMVAKFTNFLGIDIIIDRDIMCVVKTQWSSVIVMLATLWSSLNSKSHWTTAAGLSGSTAFWFSACRTDIGFWLRTLISAGLYQNHGHTQCTAATRNVTLFVIHLSSVELKFGIDIVSMLMASCTEIVNLVL